MVAVFLKNFPPRTFIRERTFIRNSRVRCFKLQTHKLQNENCKNLTKMLTKFASFLVGVIDPIAMQESGAQGYKDGRSREITTVRNQPITQGVLENGLNGLNDLDFGNSLDFGKIDESSEEQEVVERFPTWAGKFFVFFFSRFSFSVNVKIVVIF